MALGEPDFEMEREGGIYMVTVALSPSMTSLPKVSVPLAKTVLVTSSSGYVTYS